MISSIVYDGENNDKILKMNRQLYQLAGSNENVKVIELNNTTGKQSQMKKLILHDVMTSTTTKFTGSSCLKFIHCDDGPSEQAANFSNLSRLQQQT